MSEQTAVEWATAPLNDPANVGKHVWVIWNGNRNSHMRRHAPIDSVWRDRVRVRKPAGGRPISYRVHKLGHTARGNDGDYPVAIETDAWAAEYDQRRELVARIARSPYSIERLSTEQLRTIVVWLDDADKEKP